MPRSWVAHWPLPDGASDRERDQLVHTIGNLTLLMQAHNSKVSNGPWSEKRGSFDKHNVLKLNQDLLDASAGGWDDESIRTRTDQLVETVIGIWPVPEGHESGIESLVTRPKRKIGLIDLIGAGLIQPGATLTVTRKPHQHRTATLLADGQIDVDGKVYATPSGAATAISGHQTNGWQLFRVGPSARRLSKIWYDYVDELSIEADDSDAPEANDDTDDE